MADAEGCENQSGDRVEEGVKDYDTKDLSGYRHHCRHLAGNLFDIGPTSYDPAGQTWGNKKTPTAAPPGEG